MSAPVVVAVTPGSPADLAGVLPGDEIARVDGQVPRDVIEWQMFTDEADIHLDVQRNGLDLDVEVPKRAGESLGIEVQSAVFDRVRLTHEMFLKQGARIQHQTLNRLWDEATALVKDPCLGLRGAEFWHPSHFHALGYAWPVPPCVKP